MQKMYMNRILFISLTVLVNVAFSGFCSNALLDEIRDKKYRVIDQQ